MQDIYSLFHRLVNQEQDADTVCMVYSVQISSCTCDGYYNCSYLFCCVANDIIGRALKRLNVPMENQSFDTEADMVANLSAIITALPSDNQFHGPIAGKYLKLILHWAVRLLVSNFVGFYLLISMSSLQ